MTDEKETKKSWIEKFDHDKYLEHSQITSSDLEGELCRNPANLAYYIAQVAYWEKQAALAKQQRDLRYAEVILECKKSVTEKFTDKTAEATAKSDGDYQKFHRQHLDYQEQQRLFEGAVTALEKKQFSLGSINSMSRIEQDATAPAASRMTMADKVERRSRVLDAQR